MYKNQYKNQAPLPPPDLSTAEINSTHVGMIMEFRTPPSLRCDSDLVVDEESTELASSPCCSEDWLSDLSRGTAHAL